MDIIEIMKILPHRYPFLLIDRIIEITHGERAVGIKNVTINEQFFQGHFPGHPVMPGVLIVEAMAQLAGVLGFVSSSNREELERDLHRKVVYFMSLDKTKFRRPVVPGDQLRLEVSIIRSRGAVASFSGKAYVGENMVAEAEIKAMLLDRDEAAGKASEGR